MVETQTGDFIKSKCVIKAIVHPKTNIVLCLPSMSFETWNTKCFDFSFQIIRFDVSEIKQTTGSYNCIFIYIYIYKIYIYFFLHKGHLSFVFTRAGVNSVMHEDEILRYIEYWVDQEKITRDLWKTHHCFITTGFIW